MPKDGALLSARAVFSFRLYVATTPGPRNVALGQTIAGQCHPVGVTVTLGVVCEDPRLYLAMSDESGIQTVTYT